MSRSLPLAVALSLLLGPDALRAQVLDQFQETSDSILSISSIASGWQTFTSAATGQLTSVDLLLEEDCPLPGCDGSAGDLTVEIVETSGGVPTGVVLGSATVLDLDAGPGFAWIPVPFTAELVLVEAGTVYAVRLSATTPFGILQRVWNWGYAGSNVHLTGELFVDDAPGDGLDDPVVANPPADAAFRTFVIPQVCGNGSREAAEECDGGDAIDGDGCSATCQLEPAGVACRSAIAKGGSRYAAARLAALLKCRNLLAAGKTLSVDDPAECASENAAAKRIAKAAASARKSIASGRQPKCTDVLVTALFVCGETVDELIDPSAASGCLLSTNDAAVDVLLLEYGY